MIHMIIQSFCCFVKSFDLYMLSWPRKEQAKQELQCLAAQSEEGNHKKDQTIRHQTSAIEALNLELKDWPLLAAFLSDFVRICCLFLAYIDFVGEAG